MEQNVFRRDRPLISSLNVFCLVVNNDKNLCIYANPSSRFTYS